MLLKWITGLKCKTVEMEKIPLLFFEEKGYRNFFIGDKISITHNKSTHKIYMYDDRYLTWIV